MLKDYLSLFKEFPKTMGINRFRMEFSDPQIESDFLEEGQVHFIGRKRAGLIFGILIFLLFGVIDYLVFPKIKGLVWFLRFAIVIPVFSITFALTYMDKKKEKIRKFIPFLVLLATLSHLISLRFLPISANSTFYAGYLFLILYTIIFMRSGFLAGLAEMLMMGVFYVIFVLINDNIEYIDKIVGGILVLATCFIGILFTYFAEYYDRRHYITKRRTIEQASDFSLVEYPFEEAILFIDGNGTCKYISKQMENLLSLEKSSIINNPVAKIFVKNDKKRFEQSVKNNHEEAMLLEGDFHVVNKNNVVIPLRLTISPHIDHKFGEGFIMIMSDPDLEYSSAKLLSHTRQLLKEKTQEEGVSSGVKTSETPILRQEIKERNTSSGDLAKVSELERQKLQELERQLKELKMKNESLLRDVEILRKENRILKDNKVKEIDEKSADSIKLMGRMASFVSSSLSKSFAETISFLIKLESKFSKEENLAYLEPIKTGIYRGMYESASVSLKFELFEQYLKREEGKGVGVDASSILESSISQMAKYFENTSHIVEVSCKDGIEIRMNEESLKLILQNLVMDSLISATGLGEDALIEISVKEEKSKVIIDYADNGKTYPSYYREIIKLREVDSSVLSVNGIEFFFAKDLIERESSGEFSLPQSKGGNKVKMVFMK